MKTGRPRSLLVLATALALAALLGPTVAVADDGRGAVEDAVATNVVQEWRAQVTDWMALLRERMQTVVSASLDGKAGAVADGSDGPAPGSSTGSASAALLSDMACEDGRAGPWPCENVDLLSFVPNAMLGDAHGNDIWGWTDPETGHEYAIMGTGYGTSIIDVTEPTDPVVVGRVPTAAADYIPLWRDIKVYDDHAFIVAEHTSHGMQVVDLTQVRDHDGPLPQLLQPAAHYEEFGNAHNIAINEDTGFAYAVGSSDCAGGLHMIDIREPASPQYAGCFDEDGYTHDVQCVVYEGPATDLQGRELCFASNEDTVTVVDVTDKDAPVMLSRTGYDEAAYTHQGWLTPDQQWFVFGDELDEQRGTVDKTTTYIMDVSDPADPGEPVPYFHETDAIDHNLYIDGDYVWQANYMAGLRVLDYSDELLADGQLDEVAFFEVVPEADIEEFAGAWSVYPYFDSGTVIVSTLEQGLFVLGPTVDRPSLEDGQDGDGGEDGDRRGRPDSHPGKGEGRPDDPGNGKGNGGGNGKGGDGGGSQADRDAGNDAERPVGGRPGGVNAFA
jgi:choice-of-anchor B domain-containing protein